MARAPKDAQLDLFPGMTPAPAPLRVRPWRTVLPDDRRGRFESEPLDDFLIDLLRRNRQLLKALAIAGVPDDAPGVEKFRRQEAPLIDSVVELRRGKLSAAARRDLLRVAFETAETLAATRRRILGDLDPEPRERAIKAEPRVRVKDWDLRQELAEAQFAVAEEKGEIIEFVLPLAQDKESPPDVLGLADVEVLTREPLAEAHEGCSQAGSAAASESAEGSGLRADVAETIERVFPDGVVDGPVDVELSYFMDVYPRLSKQLWRIENAPPAFERDPDGGPGWGAVGVREDEIYDDLSYSYYLFFLSLRGFDFETEEESPDEDDVLRRVKGTGCVGCSVGVSLVAPVAKVVLQTMETYEDGGYTIPDIDAGKVGLGGGMSEETCRDCVGDQGLQALITLREKIVSILGSLGVEVLPADELGKIVPWLKAGEEAFVGVGPPGEEELTVADAFFFRGP